MKVHAFEESGLGKAPFRLKGYERLVFKPMPDAPAKPGGSCDHCGTAIMDAFFITSADGKTFKVGSSCVEKTGDTGLIDVVKRKARDVKRQAKLEKDMAKVQHATSLLTKNVASILADRPHPYGFEGKTQLDYVEWMLAHAGIAGKLAVSRIIERAAS